MAAKTGIKLGYGGAGVIDGTNVFITGGSITKTVTTPVIQTFDMANNTEHRGKLTVGIGTIGFEGNIAFDFSIESLALINTDFLTRNKEFSIKISDGNKGYEVSKCKWGSFTVSATPRALVSGSLSFLATNSGAEDLVVSEAQTGDGYIFEQKLLSYWNTGSIGVESFSLNITQALSPVYLNVDTKCPSYIRCGAMDASLTVSAWDDWLATQTIKLHTKTISFSKAVKESLSFSYGGPTDTGTHEYTLRAFLNASTDIKLFNIE